ncbi:MAG: methyltransferase domain-containing protein [Planctomycetaceae bacterium]|nr:methyltransferase domain-containing protein [Planctomycetaceae bacterium]
MEQETSVYKRYAAASQQVEPALCCPVEYALDYLAVIPDEIIERDYGCGDPSPFVREGETVLDLGSGGGKLCYILAQVVGSQGRIIGVDCNTEMLALARKHQQTVSDRLGYDNVDFRYGLIQDLQLDLDRMGAELSQHPVGSAADWLEVRTLEERLRREAPLVADDSVDCVVSNCVLNLVRQRDRRQLFSEIFRVLRPGGRAAISDIVSDGDVPEEMQQDGTLWSGCISGAFREDRFLEAFAQTGFHGIQIVRRQSEPWQTVGGIEFRSVTVVAYKGEPAPSPERTATVIYHGPFSQVVDDAGNVYPRGQRIAASESTRQRLQREPYAGSFSIVDGDQRREGSMLQGARLDIIGQPTDSCCGGQTPCC